MTVAVRPSGTFTSWNELSSFILPSFTNHNLKHELHHISSQQKSQSETPITTPSHKIVHLCTSSFWFENRNIRLPTPPIAIKNLFHNLRGAASNIILCVTVFGRLKMHQMLKLCNPEELRLRPGFLQSLTYRRVRLA